MQQNFSGPMDLIRSLDHDWLVAFCSLYGLRFALAAFRAARTRLGGDFYEKFFSLDFAQAILFAFFKSQK